MVGKTENILFDILPPPRLPARLGLLMTPGAPEVHGGETASRRSLLLVVTVKLLLLQVVEVGVAAGLRRPVEPLTVLFCELVAIEG